MHDLKYLEQRCVCILGVACRLAALAPADRRMVAEAALQMVESVEQTPEPVVPGVVINIVNAN
jgi:hypothetical protein